MSNQEINSNLTNYIIQLAQQPNAKDSLNLLLNNLFDNSQKEKAEEERKERAASSIVLFTTKELSTMPKQFKKIFKTGNVRAHVTQRADGLFLIRSQINKVRITASGKYLDVCKARFIEKLSKSFTQIPLQAERTSKKKQQTPLMPYMQKWLECAKKPFVKDGTYNDYVRTINNYIKPTFGDRYLEEIQSFELQEFLNEISNSGKNRTAKKIYQLLSPLFEYALADGVISLNPMAKVKLVRYEQKHGVPLTIEEEYSVLQEIKRNPTIYNQAFAFIMYTGLRRAELASVVIDGEWITLTTAKQRKGMKEKTRSIPISPMLKRVLPFIDVEKIKKASIGVLTNRFKDVCPNHHLHDLRHTFITRAQECGIRREIVSLWAGHKADNSITTTVYTHFQERSELQIIEMQKYDYKYN